MLVAIKKCKCHENEKSVHEKSVSQNIQNIFFVLKISKSVFFAVAGAAAGAGGGAYLTAITIVTFYDCCKTICTELCVVLSSPTTTNRWTDL